MIKEQIQHMVNRFLSWRLPENFHPDAGISFKAEFNENTTHPMKHQPVGTNLFTADQAEQMVRHMTEGLPEVELHAPEPKSRAARIREVLVEMRNDLTSMPQEEYDVEQNAGLMLQKALALLEAAELLRLAHRGLGIENFPTTPSGELDVRGLGISKLLDCVDKYHYYVDASDEELKEKGITREDALREVRDAEASVAYLKEQRDYRRSLMSPRSSFSFSDT